jgi:hypothetical protein
VNRASLTLYLPTDLFIMPLFTDIHPVQIEVLRTLSKLINARFSELNTEGTENDLFSFHLRKLKSEGLIEKDPNGNYLLTDEGKRFFLLVSSPDVQLRHHSRSSVILIIREGEKYLIQERLLQPYYGFLEFLTERVHWGEKVMDAGQRVLQAEIGITGDLFLKGIDHKIEINGQNETTDDKFFYILEVRNWSGEVKLQFEGGKNLWMTKKEILLQEKIHFDMPDIFRILESDEPLLTEIKGIPKGF